jgi:two-component system, OmpR family, sensor histidine kinase MprB
MTFRVRVALLATAAVAMAVLGAATLMYVVVQDQLIGEVDRSLAASVGPAREPRPGPGGPRSGGPFPTTNLSGRPDTFGQILDASGAVVRFDAQPVTALVTSDARAVAAGQHAAYFFDTTIEGVHLRVYVAPLVSGTAVELARRMDEIDRVLDETRVRLIVVGLGGVLLAAVLGALVARGALGPVTRLTDLVEQVTRTRDLSRRVATTGTDELGRLAESFNAMLAALDTSLQSQKQLVADASHELRTPLTSLRTNLELLARGQPTDPAERQQVLVDLVGQMERLSTLVADLIDLARDEESPLDVADVRLDEIVLDAVTDVRGRYPRVRFELRSEPTTVRGVRSRLARAVTNLLDNAGKWSPPDGLVDVTVAKGEVAVRDHGPGVAPEDEAHVFDRFWRASNARQLPGSGLGLAIVRDVAEAHGGSVVLDRPDGGGARFRLRVGAAA